MTDLLLPGLYGSGADHWQTWWLTSGRDARIVEQADWDNPRLKDWRERVVSAVQAAPGAILVAHSLGCALAVQLAAWRSDLAIAGALLVAPADIDNATWATAAVAGFGPLPMQRLPFPAIVIASRNDPYVSLPRARTFASRWGADFVDLGHSGHISAVDGFGPWPEGIQFAERLGDQLRRRKIA